MSSEADLAFFNDEDRHKADQITAVLDEMTPFHDLHSVYAEGVHVSTAILPEGWMNRIFTTNIEGSDPAEPYFLDPNDLVASKLSAGREKDHEFCASVLDAGLADPKTVAEYAKELPQRYSKKVLGWLSGYSISRSNRKLTERVVGVRTDSGRLFVIKISYRKGLPHQSSHRKPLALAMGRNVGHIMRSSDSRCTA